MQWSLKKMQASSSPNILPGNNHQICSEKKEIQSGPIIVSGGTINDMKATVQVDHQKLLTLEARMHGIKWKKYFRTYPWKTHWNYEQ